MRQAGIRDARRMARAYVTRLGITAPCHIRIAANAKRLAALRGLALKIVEGPLDGADSQLVRAGNRVTIMVSTRISGPAARTFIIGHELGHLMLDHPSLPSHKIGDAATKPTADGVRDYEAEANAFASELTMPYVLVRDWCRHGPVNLETPWRIARTFGTSILAAARRYAELSPERCAAVFSAHRRVLWCTASRTLTLPIARTRALDPGTVAATFWATGQVDERERHVPARAWFATSADVPIVEHATASQEHRTVLSMVWVPDDAAAPLGMTA